MSLYKTARFKVHPERIDHVETLIRDFIDHVQREEPGTLLYQSLREVENGACFLHVMVFRDAAAEEAHRISPNTVRFAERLRPETLGGVEFEDYVGVAEARAR